MRLLFFGKREKKKINARELEQKIDHLLLTRGMALLQGGENDGGEND